MAARNVETLRAIYEQWEKGNFRTVFEHLDADVLFIQRPEYPGERRLLGPEALKDGMREFLNVLEDFTIAAEDFTEAGDSIVVSTRWSAGGQGSGASTEDRYFHVWTFRGPSIIRLEHFRDRASALEAVGLSE